ncbi:hypothetical protein FACS1894187_18670 [Synergistales bacterium]|nr:hypothetical protein FACS1894187_18670 [Synergistales bacterium]
MSSGGGHADYTSDNTDRKIKLEEEINNLKQLIEPVEEVIEYYRRKMSKYEILLAIFKKRFIDGKSVDETTSEIGIARNTHNKYLKMLKNKVIDHINA